MTQKNDAPKVLLITHGNPNAQGAGEIFLRAIGTQYPSGRLVRYTLVDSLIPTANDGRWLGFNSLTRQVRFSAIPMVSSLRQWQFCRRARAGVVDEIISLVATHRIEVIWVLLNSGYTIYVAQSLMEQLRIPIVLTTLDPPEHFAKMQHFDAVTKGKMLKVYAEVLRNGRRITVASEGMRKAYRERYGVDSIVMIQGIHPALWREPRVSSSLRKECTISFAGSLYGKREWNAFVGCLKEVNATIEGSKVRVRYVGGFPRFGARCEPFIDLVGEMPFADTLRIVGQTDVAYLPYWLDEAHSYMAQTAFPSKLSAYAAARVPVFFHGPADSSPSHFMKRYPLGLCCHSLQAADILRQLRVLLFDNRVRERAYVAQQNALETELGLEIMIERFATMLGIDGGILLPLQGL